jgi:hypothetical protein
LLDVVKPEDKRILTSRNSTAWRLVGLLLLFPLLSLAVNFVPTPTKKKGAGPLFRISRKGNWGFMDRTGKTVIEPQFDWEGDFFGDLARVLIDGKWGYINELGVVVIPAHFGDAGDFTGDLAPVRVGRRWGYIDKKGKLIVDPQFQGAGEYHDGMARIEVWNTITCAQDTWDSTPVRYYARTRNFRPTQQRTFTKYNAPLYALKLQDDPVFRNLVSCGSLHRLLGYLDASGRIAIPLQFNDARDFSEGMAAVRQGHEGWGFIDKTGQVVIPYEFVEVKPFSEGLAAVQLGSLLVQRVDSEI